MSENKPESIRVVLGQDKGLSLPLRKETSLRKLLEDFPCCKGCNTFESTFKTCFGCGYRQTRIWYEKLKEVFSAYLPSLQQQLKLLEAKAKTLKQIQCSRGYYQCKQTCSRTEEECKKEFGKWVSLDDVKELLGEEK